LAVTKVPIAQVPFGERNPRQVWLNPSNPLRTNRVTLCGWVLVCRPPLALIFVKPGSGARRAAWNTNNTLTGSRAALGANPLRTNRGQLL
jgi:hypothetical protein